MSARVIDGRAEASKLRERVREGVDVMRLEHGTAPGLAVVLVGNDAASRIYVRTKARRATEAGIRSFAFELAADTSEADVLALLDRLNARVDVDAILVQLPLPEHIDTERVIRAIDPGKDVDGFHPYNVGLLAAGHPSLVPCTPLGALRLLQTAVPSLRGLEAVIVGRSRIVGRPLAQLLLLEDCTVTLAHSATRGLAAVCRRADILAIAVGRPQYVGADAIKPGATVIDVGINRVASGAASRLVGDVDFEPAAQVAGAITPVPGGVGPMTVAVLLENTLRCARALRERTAVADPQTTPLALGGTSWL